MSSNPSATYNAGPFGAWLEQIVAELEHPTTGIDVPCGECNICCRSSMFIHLDTQEPAAAAIPEPLLFVAPGQTTSQRVLGYDESGCCPMLKPASANGQCSIYAQRPNTCRAFDCRIFAATEIYPLAENQASLAQRAHQWVFETPSARDQTAHVAVQAAAQFLLSHAEELGDLLPINEVQRALTAIRIHREFINPAAPDLEQVKQILGGYV